MKIPRILLWILYDQRLSSPPWDDTGIERIVLKNIRDAFATDWMGTNLGMIPTKHVSFFVSGFSSTTRNLGNMPFGQKRRRPRRKWTDKSFSPNYQTHTRTHQLYNRKSSSGLFVLRIDDIDHHGKLSFSLLFGISGSSLCDLPRSGHVRRQKGSAQGISWWGLPWPLELLSITSLQRESVLLLQLLLATASYALHSFIADFPVGGGKIGSAHLRQQIHGVEGRLVSFVFCRNFRLTKYS